MENETKKPEKFFHSLIPLADFKAVLGIDDREDALARFCLITATYSIEEYCKRRLLLSMNRELLPINNEELVFYLREFPVSEILSVSFVGNGDRGLGNGEELEPEFYRVLPVCGSGENFPYCLSLSPAVLSLRGAGFRVAYSAGYSLSINNDIDTNNAVPPDLASACLELAAWNMLRYRSKRIGIIGNVRGAVKDGEHFEIAMPENVRLLLEPYKRKTI